MGIAIEPPDVIFGLSSFREHIYRDALKRRQDAGESVQPNPRSLPGDLDLTVYGLKRYCQLAAAGNPSLLVALYTTPLFAHEIGARLIAERDMFCSIEAAKRFAGYLMDQRERLTGERGQMRVNRTELIEKFGYDTKYAYHAVRLGLQGIEYAMYGTLTLPMPVQEKWLCLNVKMGKYTKEEALEIIREVEADLLWAITRSKLREVADREYISNFLETAYRTAYA